MFTIFPFLPLATITVQSSSGLNFQSSFALISNFSGNSLYEYPCKSNEFTKVLTFSIPQPFSIPLPNPA